MAGAALPSPELFGKITRGLTGQWREVLPHAHSAGTVALRACGHRIFPAPAITDCP